MEIKISKNKISLFFKILITSIILLAVLAFFLPFIEKDASSFDNSNVNSNGYIDNLGYVNYSPAIKSFSNKKNVLFFKANWCSTCTTADLNFQKELQNKSIPNYLTIYKVDFEKDVALKQKYGVTLQHTFVQVDNNGNELKKWIGSYTIDEVLKEIV